MAQPHNEQTIARLAAYHDRLEQAARRGAAALAEAFDDGPPGLGCHEIDTEMRILRVSPGELRLLGYSREEMVGKPVLGFIVMNETAQRSIGRKLTGETELKPFLRTFLRKDGSPIAFVLLDRYLRDASGELLGIRTVVAEAEKITAG